jgi:serine phosphatase RsbU (regulator of sigma subunit)
MFEGGSGETMAAHSTTIRRPSRAVWLVLQFLAVAGAPGAGADQGRIEPCVLTQEKLEGILSLDRGWRYHPGDDSTWADPTFDDSSWPKVASNLVQPEGVPGGWPGIGWFRRSVMLDPGVKNPTIGVWTEQAGALELYIDGELAVRFGTVSADPETERAVTPKVLDSVTLRPGEIHLLAVRFSNAKGNCFSGDIRGFTMWVGDVRKMVKWGIDHIRQQWGWTAATAGVFAAFALLHLLLFISRPNLRENLYFAVFAGTLMLVLVTELWMNSLSDLATMQVAFNVEMTLLLVMVLAALILEHEVFSRRLDIAFWVTAVVGLAILAWIWTRPAFSGIYPMFFLVILGLVDMLRLAVGALLRREPDAWVVAAGFAVLTLTMLGSFARNLGILNVPPWPLFIFGMGGLVLSFSVYLSRRVASTDRSLARRLREVHELTERTLEQEREAREQEISRRVLEADNRRKTTELDEARRLQLAMLPRSLPELRNFEAAVHMATASEVGGDYYDFLRDHNGTWTVALGDATGHGLQAGMVVGVAKSLLQAANGISDLGKMMHRIHAGLSSLHDRRASMSLLLVRLNGTSLRVASAGMPPILVRRRDSGHVDEVLWPGVPLGTLQCAEWSEHDIEMAPGDAVLLMSDGLAEVTSPDGEPFGYENVQQAFARAGALEPASAVAQLVDTADAYRSGKVISDDVTLVVLQALGN